MMDKVQTLIQRATDLRNTEVYTGTICEFHLNDEEIMVLIKQGFGIVLRDCEKFPFYITWGRNFIDKKE
jgi:3-methyladenine DNA glycosylase AlkD